jgi:hypothetical protein
MRVKLDRRSPRGRFLRYHRAMRSLAFVLFAMLSGCTSSPTPIGACTTNADCHGGTVCRDGRCQMAIDAFAPNDAGSDAGRDAPTPIDSNVDANCIPVGCAHSEVCFNGIDDDCNGMVDDGCACMVGTTERCLPGRFDPSAPLCSWGQATCGGAAEFGSWGSCTGAGGGDGGTSPYGCRRIGIMGAPGANASSDFQAWLMMQGAIVTRFHNMANAPTLTHEQLAVFDLVIVDWLQRDYTAAESTILSDWVTAGGGLFVMSGHSGSSELQDNTLLVSLGPSYDVALGLLNGPATLLPGFALTSDGAGGTLPPVTFAGGFAVIVPASLMSTLVPFATIGSNVVGVVGPFGMGRVAIWGDEWIEFDSQWSTMPAIIRLWSNGVHDLAPDRPLLPACPDS